MGLETGLNTTLACLGLGLGDYLDNRAQFHIALKQKNSAELIVLLSKKKSGILVTVPVVFWLVAFFLLSKFVCA